MRHLHLVGPETVEPEPYEELVVEVPRRRLRRDDEPTLELDTEHAELRPEAKVVVGYLTMEAHGMFEALPPSEQERVAANLAR